MHTLARLLFPIDGALGGLGGGGGSPSHSHPPPPRAERGAAPPQAPLSRHVRHVRPADKNVADRPFARRTLVYQSRRPGASGTGSLGGNATAAPCSVRAPPSGVPLASGAGARKLPSDTRRLRNGNGRGFQSLWGLRSMTTPGGGGPLSRCEGGGECIRSEGTSEAAPEAVRQAVGGGYGRLQVPLRLAVAVRETVAGHRLGALKGGGGPPPRCNASLRGVCRQG